jgi:hypothetical protein
MTDDLDTFANPVLGATPSRDLEHRLGDLIRRYVHRRSQDVAQSVVSHLEALCLHPDYDGDAAQRCAYRQLARHWRWLSQELGAGGGLTREVPHG